MQNFLRLFVPGRIICPCIMRYALSLHTQSCTDYWVCFQRSVPSVSSVASGWAYLCVVCWQCLFFVICYVVRITQWRTLPVLFPPRSKSRDYRRLHARIRIHWTHVCMRIRGHLRAHVFTLWTLHYNTQNDSRTGSLSRKTYLTISAAEFYFNWWRTLSM